MRTRHNHLLICLLLLWLPCYKANWVSFNQEMFDAKKNVFSSPHSDGEEALPLVANNDDTKEDISFKKEFDDESEDFDALRESLRLPDNQQNILKQFSQSPSKVVPDAVRYISEFAQEALDEIEKDVVLPLKNMMYFDSTSKISDGQDLNHENFNRNRLIKESKEDGNYGSGDSSSQEGSGDNVTGETSSDFDDTEGRNQYQDQKINPIFLRNREEKVQFNDVDTIGAFTKEQKQIDEVRSSKTTPTEGENKNAMDEQDNLDKPVVFGHKHVNKPDKPRSGPSRDIEELGNLVDKSKKEKGYGKNKGYKSSSTFDEFNVEKDNVSTSVNQTVLHQFSAAYEIPQNNRIAKGVSTRKDKVSLNEQKVDLRYKRSKYSDIVGINDKKQTGSKKNNIDDEDDDPPLKRTGIFESIASAFSHIDKSKKDREKELKKKKSTLEGHKELHEVNADGKQPVNGEFTPWTDWSECSESCGADSIRMRMRVCTNPSPANGGKDCKGWRFEVKYCKLPNCQGRQVNNMGDISPKNLKNPPLKTVKDRRKQIAGKGIQSQVHDDKSVDASNDLHGVNGKRAATVQKERTNTSRVIEEMFKDVIHKAFDRSKSIKQNATNSTASEKKLPPIEIHTDSGLITSENEVDTIDDAPGLTQMENDKLYKGVQESKPAGQVLSSIDASQSLEPKGAFIEKEPKDHPANDIMESEGESNVKVNKENDSTKESGNGFSTKQDQNYSSNDKEMEADVNTKKAKENDLSKIMDQSNGANIKHDQKDDSSAEDEQLNLNYNSIDGNYDVVMQADEKEQDSTDKPEVDIAKVATEIFKNNDTEAVLKALTDKTTDIIDSYPDSGSSDIKTQDEPLPKKNNPSYYLITSNHSKVSTTSSDESSQGNKLTANSLSKTNKGSGLLSQEKYKGALSVQSGLSSNLTTSNHSNINKQDMNRPDKLANSSESGNNKLKEQTKEGNFTNKENQKATANKQSENLKDKNISELSSYESSSKQNLNLKSIDWGNLHALNALVEILAEHEKNATQNNTTNQTNGFTPPTQTKSAVTNIAQETHVENTKLTSHTTHKNNDKNVSLEKEVSKGEEKNKDDYAIFEGDKRQNVSREGNAPIKSKNSGSKNPKNLDEHVKTNQPKATKKEDAKVDSDTSVDRAYVSITDTRGKKPLLNSVVNLIKDGLLSLQRTESPSTGHLDMQDKQADSKDIINDEKSNNTFTAWTTWTTCSKSCDQGTRIRMRKCLLNQKSCEGPLNQTESCQMANCPVDGGLTEWTAWSSCSTTCGTRAFKSRNRSCTNPVAEFGGAPCKGLLTEQQECKLKACGDFEIAGKIGNETIIPKSERIPREKGLWGPWSAWSKCSASCGGGGYSSRERLCLPGKKCAGPRYGTKECGTEQCPVNGGFTEWSNWSPCTPSCGRRAYRMRHRSCTNPPPSHGGRKCFDSALETEPCNIVNCPVDGGFSHWSSWSPCSKTCNSLSLSRRERECSSPSPKYGGKPCEGEIVEIKECGKQPCPINGGLSKWSSWTPCANSSCDSRLYTTRVRGCDNPRPQFGGNNCTEPLMEKKSCQFNYCPVHGGFSKWSEWSACPKNCKVAAFSHRKRQCNNPKPRYGGRRCDGPDVEARPCTDTCPVDGRFTSWTSWSSCSQDCGRTSIRSRERYCTDPSPINGGKKCKGSRFQIRVCKSNGCPGNGNFSEWSKWTKCPRCGLGVRTRERTCTNPPPTNGGKDCVGPGKEMIACPLRKCRNSGFSQWSSYGYCSKSCGGGAKMRRRTCEDESKGCDGKFIQLKPCNKHSCILGNDNLVNTNPIAFCGFNPCKISRCLGYPDAMCVTSSSCWPVFFDNRGNLLEMCKDDKAVLSSSPEMICHNNPCKTSGCYTDEAASCHVSTRCKPVFLDAHENKLDCRGLLKVPPLSVCGADPCEDKSCDIDTSARCLSDYNCSPVFISMENEILDKCKVSNYRDNSHIINSKAGKKSSQTRQYMEDMKSQLKAFLKKSDESNKKVETIAEYNGEESRVLSPQQQNELEYKLDRLKKRNRFYKPKKKKPIIIS